jgi:transposase-like protein
MTVREIQAHLEELYQIAIAPSVISTQFERLHPVVLFDCLRVKIRSPSSSNCSVSASPVSRKTIPDLAHKIPYAPDYYT